MIFFLFFASRLIFLIFAAGAPLVFHTLREGYLGSQYLAQAPYLAWVWANFDGRHYLAIADNGYTGTNFAFFPLYPFIINLAHYLIPISKLYLGLAISWLSFLVSLIFVNKIVHLDYGKKIATKTLIFLSFFPLAFFYQSVYAESLFLLGSTACFYFVRKRKWLASALFGFLAVATRPFAIALVPAILVEGGIKNKKAWFTAFISGLGLVSFMIYLQTKFGDFLLFQESLSAWGQSKFVILPQTVYRYLKIFFLVPNSLMTHWLSYVEFACVFLYFGLAYWVFKNVRKSYGVFMFSLLFIVTGLGTFTSVPRYLLSLFPGFLGLALLTKDKKKLTLMVFVIFLILGFIFTSHFTRGMYVA